VRLHQDDRLVPDVMIAKRGALERPIQQTSSRLHRNPFAGGQVSKVLTKLKDYFAWAFLFAELSTGEQKAWSVEPDGRPTRFQPVDYCRAAKLKSGFPVSSAMRFRFRDSEFITVSTRAA